MAIQVGQQAPDLELPVARWSFADFDKTIHLEPADTSSYHNRGHAIIKVATTTARLLTMTRP